MLTIQNLSYIHPDRDPLFDNLNLSVNAQDKIALIGNNGSGKSTLLKIIAGALEPTAGTLKTEAEPYYVPQIFGQYDHLTIAEALGVDHKLKALYEILEGNVAEHNYERLDDDWTIEARCDEALAIWRLEGLGLSRKMGDLSGGQKTKVFLAGISLHRPPLVLLDEPSNHLDLSGRDVLYDWVRNTKQTLVIVSHDRKLLNLLGTVCELDKNGIAVYGGNYDFYFEQKQVAAQALAQGVHDKEKALRKAKEKERETLERQHKLDARAKKNLGSAGLPKIVAHAFKNSAENSTAKLKGVHADKIGNLKQELQDLRSSLSATDTMRLGFDASKLHKGKSVFVAEGINFSYEDGRPIWNEDLNLQIGSGERIAIRGANGSGKTTLIKTILGNLVPQIGTVSAMPGRSIYIDQDYSLVDNDLKVYEQAQRFNSSAWQEHEIKIRLNRFLFAKEDWEKPCAVLSGGERMRLMLCCLHIGNRAPDLIVLDEPTNNLDIQNIGILTRAIADYRGTLLVVSHDETFLEQIGIERAIEL